MKALTQCLVRGRTQEGFERLNRHEILYNNEQASRLKDGGEKISRRGKKTGNRTFSFGHATKSQACKQELSPKKKGGRGGKRKAQERC